MISLCSVQGTAHNQQGMNKKSCPQWGLNQRLLLLLPCTEMRWEALIGP